MLLANRPLEHLALVGKKACKPSEELEGIGSLACRSGAGGFVGVVGDGAVLFVILHAAECNWITGTVAGQPYGELLVVGRGPNGVMYMESRVRPSEHALSRLDVHQLTLHEEPEHCAAEGFGECGNVVEWEVDESAVWP